ncbi:MAG: hypothetical protein JNK82_30445 [Myxococcaceae bacterium]|nr:hypothetical protein [Myxococcaceae bacterium]
MPFIVLVATLLGQEPVSMNASAAPPAPEAEIERGRLLIRDLYEEKALEVLQPFFDDESLPDGLRARALVYAGIAQMNLGEEAKAKGTFARALDVDIGATLPEWVSRKVRVTFDAELQEAMAEREPAAPLPTTRVQRHSWVLPTLAAAGAVSAAFSLLGFVRWSDAYAAHKLEPVGTTAERIYEDGYQWNTAGWILGGVGLTLLVAAALWWLLPG